MRTGLYDTIVYVMQQEGTNIFKIGVTADLVRRRKELCAVCEHDLIICRVFRFADKSDAGYIERALHSRFKHAHIGHEWFTFCDGDLDEIDFIVKLYEDMLREHEVDLHIKARFSKCWVEFVTRLSQEVVGCPDISISDPSSVDMTLVFIKTIINMSKVRGDFRE